MKKILIIHSDQFLTKENPLGGIFQYDQAKYLSENNYNIDILSAGLFSPKKFFQKKIKYLGFQKLKKIKIYRRYLKNIYPSGINIFNKKIALKISQVGLNLFEEYLKKNSKPDLIHAHDLRFGSFIAYEIHKKYKIPYVITEHNSDVLEDKYPLILKSLTQKVINSSESISTVSEGLAQKLKIFFSIKKRIKILNNVLAKNFLNLKKKRLNKKNNFFTFISVTRFDENKNVENLVKSFKKLNRDKYKNLKLKIIGTGPLFKNIENMIRKYGLSKNIVLLGYLNRNKIAYHLVNSDCFVLNSKVETFGVATIEALSCGLPVILSENPGSLEIKKKFLRQ